MNRVGSVRDLVPVTNVLVSVSDKRELESLIPGLMALPGVTIYSTGGTHGRISSIIGDESRNRLRKVSEYTGQPEMQGGLVKTLDHKIYLGLLSEPFNQEHDADRARVGAELIDMVVVNLYPFAEVVQKAGADIEDARGNIDIGGPCMLRAAAKTFLRVAAVCDPGDYAGILRELTETGGSLRLSSRFALAKKAFEHTAQYDRAIADHLSGTAAETLGKTYHVRTDGE